MPTKRITTEDLRTAWEERQHENAAQLIDNKLYSMRFEIIGGHEAWQSEVEHQHRAIKIG